MAKKNLVDKHNPDLKRPTKASVVMEPADVENRRLRELLDDCQERYSLALLDLETANSYALRMEKLATVYSHEVGMFRSVLNDIVVSLRTEQLICEPTEMDGFFIASLPDRIRQAIRDHHLADCPTNDY